MENQAESLIESHLSADSYPDPKASVPATSPYEYSLPGEYLRLVLLLVAFPLLLCFVQLASRQQLSVVSVVANLTLLVSLLSGKGAAWLRSLLVVAMTLNVFATVINPEDMYTGRDTSPFKGPNLVLLACLAVASAFELIALARQSSRQTRNKAMGWSVLAIPALIYAVGIPFASLLWDSLFSEMADLSKRDPNWTIAREISFRGAKFIVFAWFTYVGACIGSFLNVVAWCVPRGKSVALRDSCCPKCNEKIRRIDNLPIFSYINLSAKCRNCKTHIPVRYLIVELVVAAIFGSLFLYELVTGAANVPSARVLTHKGILWIIMYPKWDVISVYFFHAAFMSVVLVLSLIEWDRQKLKWPLAMVALLAFAIPSSICVPLQPIQPPEFLSAFESQMPWLAQPTKIAIGGLVGGLVGLSFSFLFSRTAISTLVPAAVLAGVVLGWQSVLHVSLLFLLIMLATKCLPRLRELFTEIPTAAFLIAIMIHHPLWKMIFDRLAI